MTQKQPVKIAMITGYLGAGKTTLLNHILSNSEGIRAAVIVNDIGEVNIDADLIANTGAVTQMDDSLIPMTNGCICCTLSEDLAEQLRELANSGDYEYIIIEASGVCEPTPIAYTIEQFCQEGEDGDAPMALDNVIAVVDCARMFDEFNGGQDLVSEEEDDIANLLVNQIEFCSTLIMNKVDAVTPEQLAELKAIVASLQRKATIIEAERGNVPLTDLLNTGRFSFDTVYTSAAWAEELEGADKKEEPEAEEHHHHHDHEHGEDCDCGCHDHDHDHHHDHGEDCDCGCHDHDHEHGHDHHHEHGPGCNCGHCHEDGHDHVADFGITTFVYHRRKPFAQPKIQKFCQDYPKEIIRTKGLIWFDDDRDNAFMFEQAGKQTYCYLMGIWAAAATPEEQAQIFAESPELKDRWDDTYGDREIKLVIIGKGMDHDAITAALDACLSE